jgi:hypothetical protein
MKIKSISLTLPVTILLILTYDLLFWHHSLGINLLIFFVTLAIGLVILFPWMKTNRTAMILLTGAVGAAVLVTVNNTAVSIFTAVSMIIIAIPFCHHVLFRSAPYALAYSSVQLLKSPKILWNGFRKFTSGSRGWEKMFRRVRVVFFPILVAFLFLIIYTIGDPQFLEVLQKPIDCIFDFLDWLFGFFFIDHLLFVFFASLLMIGIVYRSEPSLILEIEQKHSDFLHVNEETEPVKSDPLLSAIVPPILNPYLPLVSATSVKTEYQRGLITLILINLLLLCVNLVDIAKVWVESYEEVLDASGWKSNASLRSQAVHESTDALIISIFMAMAVLLFIFRGNINFIKNNKLIRHLAYFWIVQNILLATTVAIRNWLYIDDCGLTLKRIGVFSFVLATIAGLVTFYFKIAWKMSAFYLVRINSWVVAGIFLLLSVVD